MLWKHGDRDRTLSADFFGKLRNGSSIYTVPRAKQAVVSAFVRKEDRGQNVRSNFSTIKYP